MLWGAGRLLAQAVATIRGGGCAIRRSPGSVRRSHLARIASAALAVGLLGGGVPLAFIAVHVSPAVRGTLVDDPAGSMRMASVSVQLPMGGSSSQRLMTTATPIKRHALIVGINHAPGAVQLQGAVADARNVEAALLGYGFKRENVTTLLDARATRAAILSALDHLARETPPDGIAVLAIAAHTRIHDGTNQLLAADGLRVDASEIAGRMQRVRAPAWVALSTCYAEGYALPGIVGRNRIATFASSRYASAYEIGNMGSYLIIDMVRRAMVDGQAPYSVESAFHWATTYLQRTAPNRVPLIRDGIVGDLVLGPVPRGVAGAPVRARPDGSAQTHAHDASGGTSPQPTPHPGPRVPVEVCGTRSFNCSQG